MRYYVDGVDPAGGPYCAPDHGDRRRLQMPDVYHLVELAPSESLRRGYTACIAIRQALEARELSDRTRKSLHAWATTPERKQTVRQVVLFLEGRYLEEAEAVLAERYAEELKAPQAWAALAWVALDPDPQFYYGSGYLDGGILEGVLREHMCPGGQSVIVK